MTRLRASRPMERLESGIEYTIRKATEYIRGLESLTDAWYDHMWSEYRTYDGFGCLVWRV